MIILISCYWENCWFHQNSRLKWKRVMSHSQSTKLSQPTRWVHSLTSLFVTDFSSIISSSFFYTQNIWNDTNVCIYKNIFCKYFCTLFCFQHHNEVTTTYGIKFYEFDVLMPLTFRIAYRISNVFQTLEWHYKML